MKKLIFLFLSIYCFTQLDAQIYLKPIITSESSPGACDASITVIPYGGTPPYTVTWYDEGTWQPSTGFTATNLCPGKNIGITVIDANCFVLELGLRLATDPLEQIVLDTIVIGYPTLGNSDGSVQVFFSNVPSGSTTHWGDSGSGGTTTSTTFTGLDEDKYNYSIVSGGGDIFSISIPLFTSAINPCDLFRTDVYTTPVSTYLERSPECQYVSPPDSTQSDTLSTSCNGSVVVNSFGATTGDYFESIYFHLDGGATGGPVIDSLQLTDSLRCRGPFSVYSYNNSVSGNNFYNVNTVFVQDSLDTTEYWNFPDTIPSNTDTVVMDALNYSGLNYTLPIDTAFIYGLNHVGVDQYEVVTCFIQATDSFLVYTTEYLDSTFNYALDITVFEGDSLMCDVNNAYRNVIYFEWPVIEEPCDSVLICHIPPGNPNNAMNKLVPCEEVQDHLNHGDVLGGCEDRMMKLTEKTKYLQLYPNPFEETFQLSSTSTIQKTEVFTFDGKCVLSILVNANSTTIDTRELSPSTYFVKIHYADGSFDTKKMVKLTK